MEEIINIETVSQVHKMAGRSEPLHPLISVIKFTEEAARKDFDRLKVRSGLYFISLKAGHHCPMVYGRNTYDFESGSMIFIAPNQVMTFESPKTNASYGTWALVFHPDLIRKSPLGENIDQYNYFSYEANEGLHISEKEKDILFDLLGKIEYELNQNLDKHSQELIIATLELFLKYCDRFYDRQFYTRTNLNKDFVTSFERLLKDYYRSEKPFKLGLPTVKYCGESLNMSPKYLSDLLKKETGKSTQEHIHHFVINKAKNQLLASSSSISELAYDLGFEYPQHFAKVFKRKVGMSPSQYRNAS
ncbi:MAG: helix-turn-helix domain-containing protein [Bacteroidota bacterium]